MTDDLYYRKMESTPTTDLVDMKRERDERIAELEAQIEKMKCCENCVHFDFTEPNYCHKGVYRANQNVCGEWCFGN